MKFVSGKHLIIGVLLFLQTACQPEKAEQPFLMGDGYGIYSATLMVNGIEQAMDYFSDTLGFSVDDELEKGDFPGALGTMISFADLTALELLTVNDTLEKDDIAPVLKNYLAANEGVRFFALSSSSTDSTAHWLASRGFQMDSVRSSRTSEAPKGWSWDDGGVERKTLDFNGQEPAATLPRFIEEADYNYVQTMQQWRTYYGYGRRYDTHPNGVVGIKAIRMVVDDLSKAADAYRKMGFELLEDNDSIARLAIIRNQELHLVAARTAQPANTFISEGGEGIFALRFEVINLDSTYQFLNEKMPAAAMKKRPDLLIIPRESAFGVQLEFVQESAEQARLATMLRPNDQLDSVAIKHAEGMYAKYCALCHGDDRQGYAADNAPSLRSKSLLATSRNNNFMRYTIQYGRANTAMAGYRDTQGGPLEYIDIEILLQWLYETSGVEEPIKLSREPVLGDVAKGAAIYQNTCAVCHGENGEGISAPALGNPMLLATATDHFLRYAIAEGRDGTPMMAFKDSLSSEDIDAVTAFLRSRASGWNIPEADTVTIPSPDEYVINPERPSPRFDLKDGKFVSAAQVNQALQDSLRIVILDARSEVAWRQMHIPGAIPVPYYEEPENFIDDIPNDSTQIVIYCACPHAASMRVMNTLKRYGYQHTAIIDEGILVWAQMGYPVLNGN